MNVKRQVVATCNQQVHNQLVYLIRDLHDVVNQRITI
jgi:hypothetical protein